MINSFYGKWPHRTKPQGKLALKMNLKHKFGIKQLQTSKIESYVWQLSTKYRTPENPPSGNLTICFEHGTFILDLPIKKIYRNMFFQFAM